MIKKNVFKKIMRIKQMKLLKKNMYNNVKLMYIVIRKIISTKENSLIGADRVKQF